MLFKFCVPSDDRSTPMLLQYFRVTFTDIGSDTLTKAYDAERN